MMFDDIAENFIESMHEHFDKDVTRTLMTKILEFLPYLDAWLLYDYPKSFDRLHVRLLRARGLLVDLIRTYDDSKLGIWHEVFYCRFPTTRDLLVGYCSDKLTKQNKNKEMNNAN